MPTKIPAEQPTGYDIVSHGGIGNEREGSGREHNKYNLSGSCHELRVHIGESVCRILIDMGAYQWRGKLVRDMKEISTGIDTVILTHPHMDHIWEYPVAFTEGEEFESRVYATLGTKVSAEIALTDAAKIMARNYDARRDGYENMLQETAWALLTLRDNKPGKKQVPKSTRNGNRFTETGKPKDRKWDQQVALWTLQKYGIKSNATAWEYKKEMQQYDPEKPLYGLDEVLEAISRIEVTEIGEWWTEIVPGKVAFRFYNAGHIIGSVSPLIRITHDKKHTYVLFSGDLGSYKWDIHPTGLPVPPHNHPIDTVVVESTYGNRVRDDFEKGLADFQSQLTEDLEKYQQVIITTFAMDRTQNLLYRLVKMKREWLLEDTDIILDSPAGIKHTANYVRQTARLDATMHMEHAPSIHRSLRDDLIAHETELLEQFNHNIDPKNWYYTIVDKKNPMPDSNNKKIILTSSGMADGGMVVSHLERDIEDTNKVFYFPGYLVPGTLGYDLANESQPGGQRKHVTINGKPYEVQARMKQFNFLSGHGDAEDIQNWLSALNLRKWSTIRIVHGDVTGSSLEFKHRLQRSGKFPGINIIVPDIGDEHTVEFPQPKKRTPAVKK